MQFIERHGPYTDLDGQSSTKCKKCLNPYHINCLTLAAPPPLDLLFAHLCLVKIKSI